MCGISGIVRANSSLSDQDRQNLRTSIFKISHRGPDYIGYQIGQNTGFAHARLSIIDLDPRSHQPFQVNDFPYILCYNGEVYNYLSLRRELEQLGYQFLTSSDTEVVYFALVHWGTSAFDKFKGMFAIAWYSLLEESLVLARDSAGIKPLNFAIQENGSIVFSSELTGILPYIDSPEISETALEAYFTLSYIPAPYSLFKTVQKLEAGKWIRIQGNRILQTGEITFQNLNSTVNTYAVIQNAVNSQLVSDVKVGTFLSAGLDSSIITSLAAQVNPDIQAFSIGFPDTPYLDESGLAKRTAQELGIQHHTLNLSNNDFLSTAEQAIDALPEPFGDSSAIPFYAISQYAKEYISVVLSGDGADELFAGYSKYQAVNYHKNIQNFRFITSTLGLISNGLPKGREGKFSNLNRKLSRFLETRNLTSQELLWWLSSWQFPRKSEVLNSDCLKQSNFLKFQQEFLWEKHLDPIQNALKFDQKLVLANDMLLKSDSMSMANGLEARVPFLDPDVIRHASQFQAKQLIQSNKQKIPLRKAFQKDLPKHIFQQRKRGFEVPLESWVNHQFRKDIDSFIEEPHPLLSGSLSKMDVLNNFLGKHNKTFNSYYTQFYFYVLNKWLYKNLG